MSEAKTEVISSTAAIAKKIAAVFGVGAKLTLHVGASKESVVSGGSTSLAFATAELDPKLEAGSYELTVVAEDRFETVLLAPAAVKAAKAEKNPNPAARQSSNQGFKQNALR